MIKREIIGVPDCPLMHRWTLPTGKFFDIKVMVHYFLPHTIDRDPHDHPRSFWTFILRGTYTDLRMCPRCEGIGEAVFSTHWPPADCPQCGGSGEVEEVMRPGMLRHREALHTHRARAGTRGCWTIVFMGPFERNWGFRRDGQWYPVKLYEKLFGLSIRCDEESNS